MSIDKKYINEKDAALRYSYSIAWFQRSRWAGDGPPFVKVKGRILYPLEVVDKWFDDHGLRYSTSQ